MDLRKLKTLIDLVQNSGISELEIHEGDERIRIAKHAAPLPGVTQFVGVPAAGPAPEPQQAVDVAPPLPAGRVVKSPMVGTFYRASAPDAAPFVDVGKSVQVGDTLCVIEAMKLMNEIDAEIAGVIRQVLVDNGEPVEFDQPLFVIE